MITARVPLSHLDGNHKTFEKGVISLILNFITGCRGGSTFLADLSFPSSTSAELPLSKVKNSVGGKFRNERWFMSVMTFRKTV